MRSLVHHDDPFASAIIMIWHTLAVTLTSTSCVRYMCARGHGRGSGGGAYPRAGRGCYCPCRSMWLGHTEVLRQGPSSLLGNIMYACGRGRGSGSTAYSRAARGCYYASSNRPGATENQPRTFATGLARACPPLSPSARRCSTATAAQSVPDTKPPWALLPLESLSLPQGRHRARNLLDRTTAATGTAAPC